MAVQPMDIPVETLSGALRRPSVKKNVAAIHISGKLSLLQRKLSNVLLLNAYDTLTTNPTHSIDARTLAMMVGYNSNDIDTLKAALRSLAETVAEWDMLDEKGRQEWGVSSLLSYAKLKGGVCEYAYSPALAEKLHDPKVFALINLNIQKRFTSGHGLALYENCYRFVRTGSTGWWPLETFRRLMGVADSAYYETFKHLNAKIIKPAVAEVNKTSNIKLEPEFRKKGRAVSELRFLIRENPQLAMFDIDDGDAVRASGVYARLEQQGISDRLARQWIQEHGEAYVASKLDLVEDQDGVKSPVRFLSAALARDFKPASVPQASPEARAAADLRAQHEAQADQEIDARAKARSQRSAKLKVVAAHVARCNPTKRDTDRKLFAARLADPLERDDFHRNGWGSILNASAIFAFWEELEPNLFDDPEQT
ncbi:MAG: replication initiation protein [Pseudomonadota bacterium]